MPERTILFVCHGNICRSPMAEVIFRDMLAKRGMIDSFEISSRATSTEEIWQGVGNPVYPPARAELSRHGLNCDGISARLLTREDYDKCELLVAMDTQNVRNILRITGGDPKRKVHRLMEYTEHGGDVLDPWYTGQFDITYRDIYEGCTGLLKTLLQR